MYDWTTTAVTLALACVAVLYIGRRALTSRAPYPLPPGPPGLPWAGNIIGVNVGAPWVTYAEWGKTYGDIVYSRLFGKDIIILNSEKVAKDLFEHRSGNYSDRAELNTIEMYGQSWNSIVLRYGDRWRAHRRFFHQTFRSDTVSRFVPLQHQKACDVLRWLFNTPERLRDHVFQYTTSVILNSTYDYDPAYPRDELVDITADMLKILVPAARLNTAIMTGAFPFLLYLPSWLPGMSFKKQMATARTFSEQYLKRPFEYSLERMMRGSIAPSMVYDAMRGMEEKGISPSESWMELLKETSGSAFLAGSDTSNSALMMIFLMMVLNPAVQKKVQAQIDDVVGRNRLPGIDDRALLPLIDAIVWETLRCHPISPIGIAHAVVDDDVYDGLHIPKGAIVVPNFWAMGHDESKYPNPHTFMPERFLNEDGSLKPNDVGRIIFGIGRRMCVGKHFADTSVWSVLAKVLAVFKILKPLDENGAEIPVEPRFSSGIVVQPLPFGYRIVPRFPGMNREKLEQLIAASTA